MSPRVDGSAIASTSGFAAVQFIAWATGASTDTMSHAAIDHQRRTGPVRRRFVVFGVLVARRRRVAANCSTASTFRRAPTLKVVQASRGMLALFVGQSPHAAGHVRLRGRLRAGA